MRAPDTLPPEVVRDLEAMDAAVAGRPHDEGDPLLAELAALVAEIRPAPDPGAERRLDARAARGFAGAPPRWRTWLAPRKLLGPAAGLASCAVIAVVIGIAANRPGGGGDSSAGSSGGAGSVTQEARDSDAGSSGGSASAGEVAPAPSSGSAAAPAVGRAKAAPVPPPAGGGDPGSDARPTRKVERSATMTLGARARDVDAVASGAARVTTTLGGFVASSSVSSRGGGTLELRVPSARLDEAVDRLSRLARVRQLERNSLDITAQSVSVRGRIADLRAERRSLLRQLAAATTLDATAQIKARLNVVWHRLQAARAQSRRVDNRAAYANLSVTVVAERRSAAAGTWSPRDAWHDALRVLEFATGIALVAFAVALPLVLIGAPAWLARRQMTRRRRERALDAT
jgi:hypothetical protein